MALELGRVGWDPPAGPLGPPMSAVVSQAPHLGPAPPDPPPDVLLALLSRNKALEGNNYYNIQNLYTHFNFDFDK